jgi:hypothetical protein
MSGSEIVYNTIQIVPKTITDVKVIKHFKVNVSGLELFTSVTLDVELLDENYNCIKYKSFTLSGNDYLNWKNDDNYIIQKALEYLDMTPITQTN